MGASGGLFRKNTPGCPCCTTPEPCDYTVMPYGCGDRLTGATVSVKLNGTELYAGTMGSDGHWTPSTGYPVDITSAVGVLTTTLTATHFKTKTLTHIVNGCEANFCAVISYKPTLIVNANGEDYTLTMMRSPGTIFPVWASGPFNVPVSARIRTVDFNCDTSPTAECALTIGCSGSGVIVKQWYSVIGCDDPPLTDYLSGDGVGYSSIVGNGTVTSITMSPFLMSGTWSGTWDGAHPPVAATPYFTGAFTIREP